LSNNFFALDVETANSWYGSICQIGLAESQNGEIVSEWSFLVNPQTYFDPFNVGIHGITQAMVADAPKIEGIWDELLNIIRQAIVAHHGPFDRASVSKATEALLVRPHEFHWLDTSRVVRRHWPELSQRGYGLKSVCERIGYDFQHHDALEDAKAAAFILNRVMKESGNDIEWWSKRAYQKSSSSQYEGFKKEGNPNGLLAGETVLFTGELSIPRREIAEIAAKHGCNVASNLAKKVTILVIGEQDLSKLKGRSKSSKQLKVEEAIAKGQAIQILGEAGFIAALQLDEAEQRQIEERAAERISRNDRLDAKAKRSLTLEINISDYLPEDIKSKLAELANFYKQNPEAEKEDELIDSFHDMELDELAALDRAKLSDYVLEGLGDDIEVRIAE